MAKKDTSTEPHHHTGSVAPEDAELSKWIDRLWSRGEQPARVEVWQVFGRNDLTRGELIFHEDFNPKDKWDVERANKLANDILAACQHDCDSKHRPKPASYQVAVIDRNRTSSPLVRRIGPLHPKRTYALAVHGEQDGDGDEQLDIRNIELAQIREGFAEVRQDKNRNDRILGDVLLLLRDNVLESRADNRQLMGQVMSMFRELQEAQNQAVQRQLLLEKERFNLGMKKELMRSARNLIPGLFAKDEPAAAPAISHSGHANGNGHAQAPAAAEASAPRDYGPSAERTLVGNFLNDIEEEGEELGIKLFGDCEERDGRLVLIKPGIFSLSQYRTLRGVCDGRLPVSALDALIPDSGHADEITMKQIGEASDAGVTEGTAMAILEVVRLRRAAKDAAPPPSTTPTNPEAHP